MHIHGETAAGFLRPFWKKEEEKKKVVRLLRPGNEGALCRDIKGIPINEHDNRLKLISRSLRVQHKRTLRNGSLDRKIVS